MERHPSVDDLLGTAPAEPGGDPSRTARLRPVRPGRPAGSGLGRPGAQVGPGRVGEQADQAEEPTSALAGVGEAVAVETGVSPLEVPAGQPPGPAVPPATVPAGEGGLLEDGDAAATQAVAAPADQLGGPGQGLAGPSGWAGADELGFEYPTPPRVRGGASELVAREVCAWFGPNLVLERVSLVMRRSKVTALIGPSGCGKSTFLRVLNRMHEVVPGAQLAGSVELDGVDIYSGAVQATETRRRIGMVFQKPNPFPAMTIYDNVLAGLRFSRSSVPDKDALVEECLTKAGLWTEVRNRLKALGGELSGGQQQRLCIARALAVRPSVLLMDEPCSALDPTSTRRIEETIAEISEEVTVVIVTHNMQQAQRVSHYCAFFLAGENEPGRVVEQGTTEQIFDDPQDPRTADYVHGRFG